MINFCFSLWNKKEALIIYLSPKKTLSNAIVMVLVLRFGYPFLPFPHNHAWGKNSVMEHIIVGNFKGFNFSQIGTP